MCSLTTIPIPRASARGFDTTMRLRISETQNGTEKTVQVAGELVEQGVPELERVCCGCPGTLVLDLQNLRSADALGLKALLALEKDGAELRGLSHYLSLRLRLR